MNPYLVIALIAISALSIANAIRTDRNTRGLETQRDRQGEHDRRIDSTAAHLNTTRTDLSNLRNIVNDRNQPLNIDTPTKPRIDYQWTIQDVSTHRLYDLPTRTDNDKPIVWHIKRIGEPNSVALGYEETLADARNAIRQALITLRNNDMVGELDTYSGTVRFDTN